MGELLGSVPFLGRRAIPLIAAMAVVWTGWTAVRPADAEVVSAVMVAAGDIAGCGHTGDTATAAVVASTAGTVATLGDSVYNSGTAAQFKNCYEPTWGRFRWRTRPAVGNHEYRTPGASGYYDYFGDRAGPRGKGWYSYDLGAWHVVVLNSNCAKVGCGKGSEQEQWLRADLAAHQNQCTLAYWHHPRFSSDDRHGNWPMVDPFWDALYDHGAELVLSGHAHVYERFAPQTPWGTADPAFGIRQFVVGTGGNGHYGFRAAKPNSEVRNAKTLGVLKLDLRPEGYDWQFLPQAGKTFTDAGSAACHGPRSADTTSSSSTTPPTVAPSSTSTTGVAVTTTTITPALAPSSTTTITRRSRSTTKRAAAPTTTTTKPPPSTTTTTKQAASSTTTTKPSPSTTTTEPPPSTTTTKKAASSTTTTKPPRSTTTTERAEPSTTTTTKPPRSTTTTTRRSTSTTRNSYYG